MSAVSEWVIREICSHLVLVGYWIRFGEIAGVGTEHCSMVTAKHHDKMIKAHCTSKYCVVHHVRVGGSDGVLADFTNHDPCS